MASSLQHRGPDAGGVWHDQGQGIVLAHRRLSILDLSDAGAQPMQSRNGRFVISYNGEIYNHLDIRMELSKTGYDVLWNGHSDTETLLAGIECWGVEETLRRAVGMFAIALWDRKDRSLTLARDRMGEKPLYFGCHGPADNQSLIFGSELSALRKHPDFVEEIDREALGLFMRHSYIPAPYSIYRDIQKLMPGTVATWKMGSSKPHVSIYWDTVKVAKAGIEDRFGGSPEQAIDELETRLKKAVERQMISDVPLGAFLSGGIDSSTIVALMQEQSSAAVKTFTIGFETEGYNEAVHAAAVAKHLGTDHTELYVSPADALAIIPNLARIYDEPFADSSQIPTYLVCQLAKQSVTVALSGDAGDELFGGYNRYLFTKKLWSVLKNIPKPLRLMAGRSLYMLSPSQWDNLAKLTRFRRFSMVGDKIQKGAALLGSESAEKLYLGLISHFRDAGEVVLNSGNPKSFSLRSIDQAVNFDDVEMMMALDSVHYLPDDILAKVDRAAMGVSLETRIPMLDRDVVKFAWTLPENVKIRAGVTKWPLRELLYRRVPRSLVDRPKMGFGVPIAEWLRGPLADWASDLLNPERVIREGYLNAPLVKKLWDEHQSGRRNWSARLWNILMFQSWLDTHRNSSSLMTFDNSELNIVSA